MTLCIFTLENNKYYIKKYQQDLIDSIKNMVDKLNNEELFLTNLKLTFQNNEWIIKNPIISYKLIDSDKIEELTIKFMKEYGIQSTRSDLYSAVNLKLDETEYLKGKINEEDKPVMERIAKLDKQIELLKNINSKLDFEKIIIERYSNYINYVCSYNGNRCTPDPDFILNSLTGEERALITNFLGRSQNKINLYKDNDIENYFDSMLTNQHFSNNHIIIKSMKKRFLTNYRVTEDIIKAKIAKIKYDKLINKYGDKKIIEENLQDLLTKKLKLIDSDEYKNIDDV